MTDSTPASAVERPWRGPVALLSVCVFFVICTEILPVGLLPEIGAGLGVSTGRVGILVSLYAVVVAISSVPIAAVTERWPRRAVLIVLLAGYALSNLVFAVAPGYLLAVAARLVGGLAHAGFFAVAVAAAVSLVDRRRAGTAIAVIMIGNALSLVFGIPLGTIVGHAIGWRAVFGALAAIFAVLAVVIRVVLPTQRSVRQEGTASVGQGIRRPAVMLMAAVIALLALGHFTLYTYITPLLLTDGVTPSRVGFALFGYGCGGLIGLAAAGALSNRMPERALVVQIIAMAACLVLAATIPTTVGIVVVTVAWGVTFGAFPTLTQTVMLRAAGDAADAASSLVNATTNVGIAGGALLGSQLLGLLAVPRLGLVGAGLVACSLVVYLISLRRRSRAAAVPAPGR